MARAPDAREFRRWPLDFSPSVLKLKALRQWESLVPVFRERLSPFLLERWRASVFGEETDAERQRYDDDLRNGLLRGTTLWEELLSWVSSSEKLAETIGVPFVCDRAPWQVP